MLSFGSDEEEEDNEAPARSAAIAVSVAARAAGPFRTIFVADLTRFLTLFELNRTCRPLAIAEQWLTRTERGPSLQVPHHVVGLCGVAFPVSHITGLALPAMLEAEVRDDGGCHLLDELARLEAAEEDGGGGGWRMPHLAREALRELRAAPRGERRGRWFLQLAALASAMGLGEPATPLLSRYANLVPSCFEWLADEESVEAALARLREALPSYREAAFEVPLSGRIAGWELRGVVDALSPRGAPVALVELKAVAGALTDRHRMQLIVYAALWLSREPPPPPVDFLLCNALSGETLQLRCEDDADSRRILQAAERLVRLATATNPATLSDADFLDAIDVRGRR